MRYERLRLLWEPKYKYSERTSKGKPQYLIAQNAKIAGCLVLVDNLDDLRIEHWPCVNH